jgi:nucleotide-binding universal stress UspA family protein
LDLHLIVVAFDGSEDSKRAVEAACDLSKKFDSRLLVVHVYSTPNIAYAGAAGMLAPDFPKLEEAAKSNGEKVLERGVQLAGGTVPGTAGKLLESPSVVQALVDFVTDEKADLLVVGTRGMTGFKKLVLGSVSSGIVSHSPCPVLVVR